MCWHHVGHYMLLYKGKSTITKSEHYSITVLSAVTLPTPYMDITQAPITSRTSSMIFCHTLGSLLLFSLTCFMGNGGGSFNVRIMSTAVLNPSYLPFIQHPGSQQCPKVFFLNCLFPFSYFYEISWPPLAPSGKFLFHFYYCTAQ